MKHQRRQAALDNVNNNQTQPQNPTAAKKSTAATNTAKLDITLPDASPSARLSNLTTGLATSLCNATQVPAMAVPTGEPKTDGQQDLLLADNAKHDYHGLLVAVLLLIRKRVNSASRKQGNGLLNTIARRPGKKLP